jgi:hypothetical protein
VLAREMANSPAVAAVLKTPISYIVAGIDDVQRSDAMTEVVAVTVVTTPASYRATRPYTSNA